MSGVMDLVGSALSDYTQIATAQNKTAMAKAQEKQAELLNTVEQTQNANAKTAPPATNASASGSAGGGPFGLPETTFGMPTKDLLLVAAGLAAFLVIKRVN